MNKTNSKERCPYCGSIKKTGLQYLVVGTGGVGGNIAAFLWLAGKDVTCIARGKHLIAIQNEGLKLKSGLKGQHNIPISACTAEEYTGKADVIFVCVKGYSISSVIELIKKAAHKDTIVIPILNVYGTGPKIQKVIPEVTVLDGCIYIVGFVSSPGEITQMGNIFRIVFGAHKATTVNLELLEAIQKDLKESSIKTDISSDINRDTFIKWSFISAMACTGAYYNVSMGELQKEGEVRNTFINLSKESTALGEKLGISFNEDLVTYNLKVIDKLDPDSTASMQKDMKQGHESEIQGLLFEMIEMGEKEGVDMPTYKKIALKFKK
ncbi:2-dehydropantoate 2-reductase [uncultured Bacteroides sp.]|uniref:ketopantoate reductase family protein n=1 Tax=uncultured Bacteroides sp. TaxID=162156 RepID=UPI002AABDDEF|nr:2-dehydropantoate 2-reductase [uncultured Bacteroides sp.]